MEAEAAAATPITREVQERLNLVDQINTKKAETEELILELRELQKTPFRSVFGKRAKRYEFLEKEIPRKIEEIKKLEAKIPVEKTVELSPEQKIIDDEIKAEQPEGEEQPKDNETEIKDE